MANGADIPQKIYLPTSVVVSEDTKGKLDEWGLADKMTTCTPDEAMEILEGFSEEFGPDSYDVENYQPRS